MQTIYNTGELDMTGLDAVGWARKFTRCMARGDKYRLELLDRLRDRDYAVAYLDQTLMKGGNRAFLVALKDVADAHGGMAWLSGRVKLERPSLYRILSKQGNPTLNTMQEILKAMGLRVTFTRDSRR